VAIFADGMVIIDRALLVVTGLEIGCFGGWVTRDRGASAGLVAAADVMDRAETGRVEREEDRLFCWVPVLKLETWGPLPSVKTGGKRDVLEAGRAGRPVGLSTFLLASRPVTACVVGSPLDPDDERLLAADTDL
jgi:hypothetical protein